jgi:hypothetical protein
MVQARCERLKAPVLKTAAPMQVLSGGERHRERDTEDTEDTARHPGLRIVPLWASTPSNHQPLPLSPPAQRHRFGQPILHRQQTGSPAAVYSCEVEAARHLRSSPSQSDPQLGSSSSQGRRTDHSGRQGTLFAHTNAITDCYLTALSTSIHRDRLHL